MFIAALTFVTALAVAQTTTPQQPPAPQTQAPQSSAQTAPAPGTAPQATLPSTPELPVLDARLGGCTADFTVKGPEGAPVYLALIHVRVRYGALGIKRMDLEVGTNSEGKARVKGLPDEARLMAWDITKDDKKTVVDQDVKKTCQGKFDVTLK